VQWLHSGLWQQKNWLFHHDNVPSPTHSTLLCFLKDHHFDITEVMEAETQAVLKTLTKQDFHVAFKNW
jgi:hypothetical protein